MESQPKTPPKDKRQYSSAMMWIPVGIGVGVAIGVALNNIAVGIAIGAAIGVALSAANVKKSKGSSNKQ